MLKKQNALHICVAAERR